jgi:endonuclease/exonuclease/phosphatase family metal-dependent hydrolase
MFRSIPYRLLETTSILLFFLQAIRVIFSVMFGIIYDQIFTGPMNAWLYLSVLLVLGALVAPVISPQSPGRSWIAFLAILAAISRLTLSINQAEVRYWGSLVVLAAGGLYLAAMLVANRPVVWPAMTLALGIDQILRLLGDTYDLGLRPGWLPVQGIWSIALIALSIWLSRNARPSPRAYAPPGVLWGLAMGGFFFLETSLLASPNAISRWSNWPYALVTPLLLVVTLLPLFTRFNQSMAHSLCTNRNLHFGGAILLLIALPAGYFLTGFISAIALLAAQFVAISGLCYFMDVSRGGKLTPGTSLAFGMFLFLIFNFLNAFAFTYPYTLPFMRGEGWVIYLLASLVLVVDLILQRGPARPLTEPVIAARGLVIFSLLSLILSVYWVQPQPTDPMPTGGKIRAGTYNIHYGYDTTWHYTLEDVASNIETNQVDLVALQEVDTGRLTSYGVDDAYYLSRRLHMNLIYLPTVEHLTGIALLYHGFADKTKGQLISSNQEQTGIVHAHLILNTRSLDAFGIWMGLSNEDTQRQIQQALDFIGGLSPATFGGDFNATSDSPVVEAVRQAGFIDPFLQLGIDPPPPTDPAIDPRERIDYLWLRQVTPLQAWVSDSLASDHRMVVVELQIPP